MIKDNTISACMILKNEEKNIADCLKTLEGWVDELCIIDTGCDDDTMRIIAEKWNGELITDTYEWNDDFSAARNKSLRLATKSWIFVIDADERCIAERGIRLKNEHLPKISANVLTIDLINFCGQPPKARHRSVQMRFFKRDYDPCYEGRFHNRVVVTDKAEIFATNFILNHYGDAAGKELSQQKIDRRRRMGEIMIEEEPLNPWSWYNYVRALWSTHDDKFDLSQKDNIGEALRKGIDACEDSSLNGTSESAYLQLLVLMGTFKHITGQSKESIKYLRTAIGIKPDYLDALFLLAVAYTYGISIVDGERWAKRYLEEQEHYDFQKLDAISMNYAQDREGAYRMLADIARHKDLLKFGMAPKETPVNSNVEK